MALCDSGEQSNYLWCCLCLLFSCILLFEYLVDQFSERNIFGAYIPKHELTKAKETCKEILFDSCSDSSDVEKEYLQLLKYAILRLF